MLYVSEKSEVDTYYITVDPDTMLKELGTNDLSDIKTTRDALSPDALRCGECEKFLSAAVAGEDMHTEHHIVTKCKFLDPMVKEGVPPSLRTHDADSNVFSQMWCLTHNDELLFCSTICDGTTAVSSTELEDTATVITRNVLVLDETQCSTLKVHASTVGRPTPEPDADEDGVDGYTYYPPHQNTSRAP